MVSFLVTAVLIAIPTYFYAWLVRSIDRFEKEPAPYLIAAFLWGALPAVIAGLILQLLFNIPVELLLGANSLGGQVITTAITAPVTEELLKGAAVAIIYFQRRREFDGWVDGLVYGATAGFGFAYVENILYIMGTESVEEWIALFFLRVIILGFMHGFWTALTGIGFGLARHLRNPFQRSLVIAGGLIAAIAGHLIHNGSLVLAQISEGATILITIANYCFLALLMMVLGFVAAINDRKLLKIYLKDEVPHILSAESYEALISSRSNALAQFHLSPKQKRAFIQIAAELAQKKHQFLKMGEEEGNSAEIEQLRLTLKQMSQ
ncbi:MAG: PrsW family intramembrane metalloprotease [Leptolyngbyaceae bacterium]|nr:PrsW family intramembrane metalloprotease [Leptolyngbyaceae bacterium]